MPFIFADRVKELSATLGAGDFILAGFVPGFRTWSAGVGDANQAYYTIVNEDGSWEVGICTINGVTLTRDTILSSSNGGAIVNFGAGTKTVFSPPTAQAFTNALSTSSHALVDHSTGVAGVPAPEAFTQVAHDAEDHSSQFGVPAPESFDEGDHSTTDHAGIPGIGEVGPSTPDQWSINRVSSVSPVDLTATTSGIHFVSMALGGANLGTLIVNASSTPSDAYPFLVIFNEDINNKAGTLDVFGSGVAPLVSLAPREGARLWHTGSATSEYSVELILPQNATTSEILRLYYGNVNANNQWFNKLADPSLITTTPLDGGVHDIPVLSPLRLLAMSWRSDGVGGSPTDLSIEDELENVLTFAQLPTGQFGSLTIDATINPVAGAVENDTKAINLKFLSGGDKGSTNIALYGFSRDGGLEMHFTRDQNAGDATRRLYSGMSFQNGLPIVAESTQVIPDDSLLDRVSITTSVATTFDLDVLVDGAVRETLAVVTVAGVARLFNFISPIPVLVGAGIEFEIRNAPTIAPFPDEVHVVVRFRQSRGFLLPFGGDDQFLRLGASPNVNGATANSTASSFICPVGFQILRMAWITESTKPGDQLVVKKDGATVFTTRIDGGIPGGVIEDAPKYIDTPGVFFDAGDRLEIEAQGFSNDSTNVLLHCTALTQNDPLGGGGGGGAGGGTGGLVIQRVRSERADSLRLGLSVFPLDDSIPQSNEGIQILTVPITPTGVGNIMVARAQLNYSTFGIRNWVIAIFNNKSFDAIGVVWNRLDESGSGQTTTIEFEYTTVDLLPLIFELRMGSHQSHTSGSYLNGEEVNGNRFYGGVLTTWFEVREENP